ncbi:basic salivary proline-rich protein 4-like [Prinia subflava]|uniref:basic salivary proline-rich protein 4-like n=1 Tax=Prinia subflava TaxID=208062 RepID=UPI002FE0FD55
MRSVHSPPPPAATGEKPPGHRLGPSPPLSERHGPCAAPQRASRRAPRRPAAGRSTQRRGRGACGQRSPPPAGRQWGSPAEPPAAAAERARPRQPEAARPCPPLPARRRPPGERPQPPPAAPATPLSSPPSSGDSGTGEGPPVYATATGAAHRLRRAGQGWAGLGRAGGGAGEREPRWGLRWELRGDAAGRALCPRRRGRWALAVTLGARSCCRRCSCARAEGTAWFPSRGRAVQGLAKPPPDL